LGSEPTTVDGISAVQLLRKIEARNPDKRLIHLIWDNALYHKGPNIRHFLSPLGGAFTSSSFHHTARISTR